MKPRPEPGYSRFHPRWHRDRMPIFWWVESFAFTKFIIRELTSLAVGYSAVLLLFTYRAVTAGDAAFQGFLAWLGSPLVVVLHWIVLLALVFHTVTWLNLAPKALVVKVGGKRLPDGLVVAGHYAAWVVASVAVVAYLMVAR